MWKYRGRSRPDFAQAPAAGQESVWDYPRPPCIVDDARHVVVRTEGKVIAETRAALRVCETASPPTFYLPRKDIRLEALMVVPGRSACEWKGAARYWGLVRRGDTPVAWDYPRPSRAFVRLEGYFAFYPSRIRCFVDDEQVRPQPGHFYGGWVTDDVAGPFKGEPGTGHW